MARSHSSALKRLPPVSWGLSMWLSSQHRGMGLRFEPHWTPAVVKSIWFSPACLVRCFCLVSGRDGRSGVLIRPKPYFQGFEFMTRLFGCQGPGGKGTPNCLEIYSKTTPRLSNQYRDVGAGLNWISEKTQTFCGKKKGVAGI